MSGMNRVMLIGNLGKDPEVRATTSGRFVASFTLATNEHYKDREGQTQLHTEWHRVVTFGRQAEIARDFLKKGRQVFVEGRLQTREWQDKEGQKRYTTEVVVIQMKLLGSGPPPDAPSLVAAGPGPREADVPF